MFQKRSLTTGFLVASLGLAAGFAVLGSSDVASADDCGNLKKASVQAACKKGGKKAVDQAMKDAVKAANKDGAKLACKDCHDQSKNNELKGDAESKFDSQLAKYFK